MTASADRFQFAPSIMSDLIGGETVGINLETGDYFSLRGTASDIWDVIRRRGSISEMVQTICDAYDGDPAIIEAAVRSFVTQLVGDGLVQPADASTATETSTAPPRKVERRPFAPPAIEKFSDMREFLLVDPIHEVDVTSWPQVRTRSDQSS